MPIDKKQLMEQFSAMIDEANKTEKKVPATMAMLENRINLKSSIDNILKAEKRNAGLTALCESYLNALNAGQPDELLYESFISNASNYSYLNAVDTELSAINDRIKKYKQDIDLTKLLRLMEQTTSYYIVPLIEECVVNYVKDKTPNNRVALRQALSAFQGDPYVKEMNNILNLDNSIPNNVYLGESYERANTIMHTDTICSPVQYIKENESVFNVKGNYYVRKGNVISKLSKQNITALPEDFRTLCEAVNSPMVTFNMNNQSAEIMDNTDYITVSNEGKLFHHGNPLSESEYQNMKNVSFMMNENRSAFFNVVDIIKDNIAENIAVLDFVKHVELNESADRSVDVFRIKDNIFITTIDESMGKTTFYRNVNPIQAKKLINEHMNLNVSALFEDVLPNQEKIQKEIEETCKEYETYIQELSEKKDALESLKEDADEETSNEIKEALKLVEDELEKTKKDYKDYQDSVKDYTDKPEDKEEDSAIPSAEDDEDRSILGDEEGDGDSEEVENQDDLENPIQSELGAEPTVDGLPAEDGTDMNFDDAPEFDPILDVPATNGQAPASPEQPSTTAEDKFQIVNVAYNKNIKTGKVSNKGEVHVIIPSVDINGNLIQDMKKITFYIGQDGTPIINNEYMPLDMYNAILDAVKNSPETANVDPNADADMTAPAQPAEIPADAALAVPDATVTADTPDNFSITATATATDNDADILGGLDDVLIDPDTFNEEPEPAPAENAGIFNRDEFEDNDNAAAADDEEKETPDEAASVSKHYPIEVKLDMKNQYLAKIQPKTFIAFLTDHNINFAKKGDDETKLTISVENKADIFAIKNFFAEWLNWTDDNFFNFFREFSIAESVKITGISFINEDLNLDSDDDGSVSLDIPFEEELVDLLEEEGFKVSEPDEDDFVTIETSGLDDTRDLYFLLKDYADEHEYDLEDEDYEELRNFFEFYAEEFDDLDNSSKSVEDFLEEHGGMELPADDELIRDLEDAGLYFEENEDGETIYVTVDDKDEATTLADIVSQHNLEDYSSEVNDFMNTSESFSNFVNEGVKITVKDDKTGKTVEIDTDDLNDADSKGENDDENQNKEDDITFNNDETDLFGDSDEVKQAEDEKKEDEKQNEEASVDKPKKQFKFRPKSKVSESAETKADQPLNESAAPKFKINADTLNKIYESMMLRCGLFMNGVQITPADCYVNYGEYRKAGEGDDVRIILEGEKTTACKKYIQLLEAASFNEDNYIEGVEVTEDGKALRNIYINTEEYTNAQDVEDPVSCIDENGASFILPKRSIKTLTV